MKHTIPSELIASSRSKFLLALSRSRREQYDLALLSLHGSLHDGLRAYLALHRYTADTWDELFATLSNDERVPLFSYDIERIQRTSLLCDRIAHGEPLTLMHDTIQGYQEFVAALLQRYGITVITPDDDTSDIILPPPSKVAMHNHDLLARIPMVWKHRHKHIRTVPLIIIVLLCIIAATTTTIVIYITRSEVANVAEPDVPPDMQGWATTVPTPAPIPSSTAQSTSTPPQPTPTNTPDNGLPRIATVRQDVESLAIREQPSSNETTPVLFYITAGAVVTVIEGPVEQEEYTWWRVRIVRDNAIHEGWCAGDFLVME